MGIYQRMPILVHAASASEILSLIDPSVADARPEWIHALIESGCITVNEGDIQVSFNQSERFYVCSDEYLILDGYGNLSKMLDVEFENTHLMGPSTTEGMIVSPRAMKLMYDACMNFVRKCETGRAVSTESYREMRAATEAARMTEVKFVKAGEIES